MNIYYSRRQLNRFACAELSMIAADGLGIALEYFMKPEFNDQALIEAILVAQALQRGKSVILADIPPSRFLPIGGVKFEARQYMDRWFVAIVSEVDPRKWAIDQECTSKEDAERKKWLWL